MAVMDTSYYSDILEMQCSMRVVYPQKICDYGVPIKDGAEPPFPVVYFLHGRSGGHNLMHRFWWLELYAQIYGCSIVMPDIHNSWYTDQAHGFPYLSFLADELPCIVSELFKISTAPENSYTVGYSMGGYGALKLGLTYPDRYAACANMSGSPDIAYSMLTNPLGRPGTHRILDASFGGAENLRGSKDDLYALADRIVAEKAPHPRFYITVGTEDTDFLEVNRRFKERFGEPLGITYVERPGKHNWKFWNERLRDVFTWFNMHRDGIEK